MAWSKKVKVTQAQADDFVKAYFSGQVTDLYQQSAAARGEFPNTFIYMSDMYRDYITQGFRLEVTFAQFVKALKAIKPRRCFDNNYGQIVIGHTLGKPVALEEQQLEEVTVV